MGKKKKNILGIWSAALKTPRLIKQMMTLREAGYGADILYWNRQLREVIDRYKIDAVKEKIGVYEIKTIKAPYGRGIFGVYPRLSYFLKTLFFLLKWGSRYSLIQAVDFDSALPAFFYKAFLNRKIKFIYDIADFIETFYSPIPGFLRKSIRLVDKKIMGIADAIILPDTNRLVNIPENFKEKVFIINNAPAIDLNRVQKLAKKFHLFHPDKINVFYCGAFSKDRGIEMLLEVCNNLKEKMDVYFAGWGTLEKKIKESSEKLSNVYYLGGLSEERVLAYLSLMDISYIMYSPDYEHNCLASPCKIFEAFAMGRPVIVAEGTSIDVLVKKYDAGYVVSYNREKLKSFFQNIKKEDLKAKGKKAAKIYQQFSWDGSKQILLKLYSNLLKEPSEPVVQKNDPNHKMSSL